MHSPETRLSVRDAMLRLRRDYGHAPSYAKLWRALTEGHVDVEKTGIGLKLRESDLPVLAAALGLQPSAEADGR